MEERIQELLRIAKQNGTQATTVLLEIEQLLNSDNDEIQELLEKAKQNGTQATTVLLEIEQLLNGYDAKIQELLEKAKQNGTQATTVLTEIVENATKLIKPIKGSMKCYWSTDNGYCWLICEMTDGTYRSVGGVVVDEVDEELGIFSFSPSPLPDDVTTAEAAELVAKHFGFHNIVSGAPYDIVDYEARIADYSYNEEDNKATYRVMIYVNGVRINNPNDFMSGVSSPVAIPVINPEDVGGTTVPEG